MKSTDLIQRANKKLIALKLTAGELDNYFDLVSGGEKFSLKELSYSELEEFNAMLGKVLKKREAETSKSNLSAALSHANNGHLVFPIAQGKKAPPIVSFTERATSDAEVINQLWKVNPNYNIGIHTKDLIVVDMDAHKGGQDVIDALETPLPKTYTVSTPNGGKHFFYHFKGGVKNSVDVLGKGVDIRSNNGYVVAAGSEIEAGKYEVFDDSPIVDAPQWLIDKCKRVIEKAKTDKFLSELNESQSEVTKKRCLDYLINIHKGAVQGDGGDMHTYNAACYLYGQGLSESDCLDVLLEYNEHCEPPWSANELQTKIDSAFKYAQQEHGAENTINKFEQLEPDENKPAEKPKKPKTHSKLHFVSDLEIPSKINREYIWKGHLPKKCLGVLYGPPNEGKSIFAKSLLVHYASSQKYFLNDRVGTGGGLYVALEGHEGIPYRFKALQKHHVEFNWDEMPIAWMDLFLPLAKIGNTNPAQLQGRIDLENFIEAFKQRTDNYPDIIVLDNLTEVARGDTNGAETIAEINEYAKDLIERFDCTVLYVHHPNKANPKDERGSGHIRASASAALQINKGVVTDMKQRDYGKGEQGFTIKVIPIGTDQDQDIVSSVVIVPREMSTVPACALESDERKRLRVIKELCDSSDDGEVLQSLITNRWVELGLASDDTEPAKRASRLQHNAFASDGYTERSGGTSYIRTQVTEKALIELGFENEDIL